MELSNSLKEYALDSLLPAPCYREEEFRFIDANRLRLYIKGSAYRLSKQQYSRQCAIAASEFLNWFYTTDCDSDDLVRIFHRAIQMIEISEYHRVYTQDQRRWLEDVAKRWSDGEAIEQEFSFLRSQGAWLASRLVDECLDYAAIEVGLKRWMAIQDDRERQSRDGSKFIVRNSSEEEQSVFKVKML